MRMLLIVIFMVGLAVWVVAGRQPGRDPVRDIRRWQASRNALRQLAQAPAPGSYPTRADHDEAGGIEDLNVGSNVRHRARGKPYG